MNTPDPIATVEDEGADVALSPGPSADTAEEVARFISAEVRAKYDVFSYHHAAAILSNCYPKELKEIEAALLGFTLSVATIGAPGGNESDIPKAFSFALRPQGWLEARISGDLTVKRQTYSEEAVAGKLKKTKLPADLPIVIENIIDGHKIDYVKSKVAFDLEWNSKDQTFDRDLYAFRAFHETGLISVGVMLTRSASLNPLFSRVPQLAKDGSKTGTSVKAKYGASTTWMGKLLYRMNAGRHGGCPVLVFGITPAVITDLDTLT